jgi:hypothetical protein
MLTLLETIHGSHLYGLATSSSDRDFYRVVDQLGHSRKRNVTQKISGDTDTIIASLSDFTLDAANGNPKALEAMFSMTSSGPLKAFADSYYLNSTTTRKHYHSVIRNFAYRALTDETLRELIVPYLEPGKTFSSMGKYCSAGYGSKYKRHAARLLLNLDTGLKEGRFNPTLTPREIEEVQAVSHYSEEAFAEYVLDRL